ncbi:hypothetical protein Tco_0290473 [Tanacetum coccineum]
MKEVFDQIEAEVDQNAVDKKCDEIERKNILIENENLTAECLSKDVFYTATDYVLTVSRFSDMHDAYTAAQKRLFLQTPRTTDDIEDMTFDVYVLLDYGALCCNGFVQSALNAGLDCTRWQWLSTVESQ